MILAVLDTNVLASAARKLRDPESTPGRVLQHWFDGAYELICSAVILRELERTLSKPYFRDHISDEQITELLGALREYAVFSELSVVVSGVATHAADDLILATAVSAGADVLVTGDRALLGIGAYHGVQIMSARAFLDLLDEESAGKD